MLERSLLAADSGGTVPVRTEVSLALHSLLFTPRIFLFFLSPWFVSFCCFFCIYFIIFFFRRGGRALGGWSIYLFWEGWSIGKGVEHFIAAFISFFFFFSFLFILFFFFFFFSFYYCYFNFLSFSPWFVTFVFIFIFSVREGEHWEGWSI